MALTDLNLARIFGYRDVLSLDARHRFRLPDGLAASLHQEQGRVGPQTNLPRAAVQRLAFYFVPGTKRRIFLYPASNIEIAITRFECPPPGKDPEELRAARDYFYSAMTFVEADRQNRLQVPDHLLEHAGLEGERQVVLMSHNYWLSIAGTSVAKDINARGREALEKIGPEVLDPVQSQPQASAQGNAER
jgi:DNA-binding transcriptional regulator/RsmH inhibitor MraZ